MLDYLPAWIASLVPLSWFADWLESKTHELEPYLSPDPEKWIWRGRDKETGRVVWSIRLPVYRWRRADRTRRWTWHKLTLLHIQGQGWLSYWWEIPVDLERSHAGRQ